jgi:TolB-like protein
LLCITGSFFVPGIHAQQNYTIHTALTNTSRFIIDRLPAGSTVVVLNFQSAHEHLSDYIIDELIMHLANDRSLVVVDRQNMDTIRQEMNLQASGDVSDESAQAIGRMLGAQTIISGAITQMGSVYRLRVRAIAVETAAIQAVQNINIMMDETLAALTGTPFTRSARAAPQQRPAREPAPAREPRPVREREEVENDARFATLGIAVGTTFAAPLAVATVTATIAPFRHSFLEIGCDVGVFTEEETVELISIFPFVHYAVFMPFKNKGGWYAGVGVGYMLSFYTFFEEFSHYDGNSHMSSDAFSILIEPFAVSFTAVVIIVDALNISYTLRTDFENASNKLSVGYTYRFMSRR